MGEILSKPLFDYFSTFCSHEMFANLRAASRRIRACSEAKLIAGRFTRAEFLKLNPLFALFLCGVDGISAVIGHFWEGITTENAGEFNVEVPIPGAVELFTRTVRKASVLTQNPYPIRKFVVTLGCCFGGHFQMMQELFGGTRKAKTEIAAQKVLQRHLRSDNMPTHWRKFMLNAIYCGGHEEFIKQFRTSEETFSVRQLKSFAKWANLGGHPNLVSLCAKWTDEYIWKTSANYICQFLGLTLCNTSALIDTLKAIGNDWVHIFPYINYPDRLIEFLGVHKEICSYPTRELAYIICQYHYDTFPQFLEYFADDLGIKAVFAMLRGRIAVLKRIDASAAVIESVATSSRRIIDEDNLYPGILTHEGRPDNVGIRHIGCTWSWIFANDRDYCDWLLLNSKDFPQAARYLLARVELCN
jgi:hypothetical protein